MIRTRLGLQTLLESLFLILNTGGMDEAIEDRGSFDPATDANVYFQPPSMDKMRYPCITYSLSAEDVKHANDKTYTRHLLYTVTVIDANPDGNLTNLVAELPMCKFVRQYKANNKYHNVYDLYY